ncbi:MAG: succinate dehydrogenase cytochrome b subunit [Muribaculaceae bacterium]|nr:succinate dehydrogenase cytochrome b subunit [Muribaculaceae bacterium]
MWLTSSSIGRKFVMAITGVCLVLFVTFHVLMNSVALIWPDAYNMVCEFLGANWYALIASMGLALLFIIHIIYAVWLTLQNRKARGTDRYAVAGAAPGVEWSSKNMLVLGIVILAFLVVHMTQFWAKMQLQELISHDLSVLPQVNEAPADPAMGTLFLQLAFQEWWTPVVYIIGFVALWFHMNHGFWSMFQTVGWDNNIWLGRLKKIACWWTSIVVLLFVAQAILFTVQAHNKFFLNDPALVEQYGEYWENKAENLIAEYSAEVSGFSQTDPDAATAFFAEKGADYADQAEAIARYSAIQAPDYSGQNLSQMGQFAQFMRIRADRAKEQVAKQQNLNEDMQPAEKELNTNE